MKIVVKRVNRDYREAEIWRVEILSTIQKLDGLRNLHVSSAFDPNAPIGEAIETHQSHIESMKKRYLK